MSRIFISYKRVDKDKVFKIKDQIEVALGEKCWIDLDGIESDAQFASVIIDAIDEAEIVLFMHSEAHTRISDFESDWTVRELNYAKEEGKRIVFLNIDQAPLTKWFKFMFPQKQQVDATSGESLQRLITDLRCWLANGTRLLIPQSAEAIDLGLSVKWANMNIGAEKVTDYGDYFAWGETEPKNYEDYNIDNYKWCDPDPEEDLFSKYANDVDNKTVLDPEDDAAVVKWGGKWRMPTNEEIAELLDNCYWAWTEDYKNSGVAGYIVYRAKNDDDKGVVSKKDDDLLQDYSYSDYHIFLPATGNLSGYGNGIKNDTYSGFYWSKSLFDDGYSMDAFCLCFVYKDLDRETYDRQCGLVVRAVCS